MRLGQRVLFVHNGPLFRARDGKVYGIHITDALKQRYLLLGDHVTFLMRESHLSEPTERFSELSGSDFEFTPVPDLLSPSRRIQNYRAANRCVKMAVEGADVIVARVPSLTSRLAIEWARRLKKPYMVECVACNWDALWNHNWRAKLSAPYFFLMQKRVIWHSSHVIYVTESFLQRRYPTRGKHAAVSNVQLAPTPESVLERRLARIRSREGTERVIRLATIANVGVPYKSQADIIAVLPTLMNDGIEIEYHLIGAGDPSRLEAVARRHGVQDRVILHGAVRHAQIFALLDDMDAYVQPSRQEGLPRALIEAMSRGLPAAGARTGGIPELLPEHRLFTAGERNETASVLKNLLKDDEITREARKNFVRAADFVAERLDLKRLQFYDEFLDDHGLPARRDP